MTAPAQPSASQTEIPLTPAADRLRTLAPILAVAIFLVGAAIRLMADFGFKDTGYDEALYRDYILMADKVGFTEFPNICEYYLIDQRKPENQAKLPPTRFLYVFCGWVAKHIAFGDAPPVKLNQPGSADRDPAFVSLHRVSLIFSILTVGLCGLAAWRMIGPGVGVCVMALVAASPLGIHMGKHALVDGFFAFWATLGLWLLWENLQRPNNVRWLVAFGASLALMVMTKENSFFVYIAMCGILVLNRWARFGTVTRGLVFTGVFGPLFAVGVLVSLAGGIAPFVEIYKLLVTKAQNLDYAIATGDGPWYRYLIELMVSDPIVLVLALTGLLTLPLKNKAFGYLIAFVAFSYLMMCNVKYAMNLRYTTIWMLPLAALASAQILQLAGYAGRFPRTIAAVAIAGICAFNLGQYKTFFVNNAIYEPVPLDTLRAIRILKEIPQPK